MSMTAKPGEFEISNEVSQRAVASNRRASASTFCPNSAQSRSGITDSGQRYEVRLNGARVQLRRPGEPWRNLVPLDPTDPFGMSMHDSREGDRIDTPIRFDMVAASRGRLLAKEEGTDRFFSLIIDPLFRTSQKTLPNGSVTTTSADGGDPVVPSNYLKLDPEFFLPSADAIAPRDFKAHYQHHPAGDRFPLFVRALEAQLTDMWVVLPKPRVWYLVDARSPLKVFDFDDLFCFSDEDARAAFTKARVKAVLVEGLHGFYRDEDLLAVAQTAASQIADRVVPNVVSDQISDRLRNIRVAARAIRSFVRGLEGIPGVGAILRNVRTTVTAMLDGLDGFAAAIRSAVRARINALAQEILDIFVAVAADVLAARIRSEVQAHGFAALLRPALLIGTCVGGELNGRGVIAPVDYGSGRAPTPQQLRCGGSRKALGINIKRLGTFLDAQSNQAVGRLVDAIIDVGRRRRGIGDASAPPAELPTYRHVEYQERRASGPRQYARHSIEFSKVMDLGVGTVHWSEQWHQGFGGELQALWSRRRYLAQEVLGMTVYRFMNGPVVDGDGWQDGTTNFYALVKIPPGPKESTRKFAVIYLDEQTYFTLRWRLVHPFKDVAGDAISIARQLRDNPENFNFDASTYWDPFEAGNITDYSRMGVSRQIIAVTGMDAQTSEPEIYTYCFAFGISDHTWRWRRFPSDNVGSLPEPVVSSSAALPESPGGRGFTRTPWQSGRTAACTYEVGRSSHQANHRFKVVGTRNTCPPTALMRRSSMSLRRASRHVATRIHGPLSPRRRFVPWTPSTCWVPMSVGLIRAASTTRWTCETP